MYYLLYEKEGSLKKFPLTKGEITIGRGWGSDLRLTGKDISKNHCRVKLSKDHLLITDLRSRNGTFVGDTRIDEAKIALNNSFGVGSTEFYFKLGDIREFNLSKSLSDLYSGLARARRAEAEKEPDTELRGNRLESALQVIAERALLDDELPAFLRQAGHHLDKTLASGAIWYFAAGMRYRLYFRLPFAEEALELVDPEKLIEKGSAVIAGKEIFAQRFSSALPGIDHFLLCVHTGGKHRPFDPADFFPRLLEIIEVQLKLTTSSCWMTQSPALLFEGPGFTITGAAPVLKKTVDLARKIAAKSSFVLILGESGTGKELIARMIHYLSKRKDFVALNCAAIPATLLESELFGYERGAFTDARQRKIGKIEVASGGTLLLDEIGDMPLETQAKLLRVIQEKAIVRLGGNETIAVDLRIIAMTNRNLTEWVQLGRFRQDLYFRLRMHQITMPPLRERREDIPHLIRHFTTVSSRRNGISPAGFSEEVEDILLRYDWPGNVRELENEINRIVETIDDGEVIGRHHLLPDIVAGVPGPEPERLATVSPRKAQALQEEKAMIAALMRKHGGNKMRAARELGITYRGFLKKVKRLGIS